MVTVITLDPSCFSELSLRRCLSFLYTGVVDLNKDSEALSDTITAANLLNLPELALICENAHKEEEFLNPSIGTWLNDRNSSVAKDLFFNKVRESQACIFPQTPLHCSYSFCAAWNSSLALPLAPALAPALTLALATSP